MTIIKTLISVAMTMRMMMITMTMMIEMVMMVVIMLIVVIMMIMMILIVMIMMILTVMIMMMMRIILDYNYHNFDKKFHYDMNDDDNNDNANDHNYSDVDSSDRTSHPGIRCGANFSHPSLHPFSHSRRGCAPATAAKGNVMDNPVRKVHIPLSDQ